MSCRALFRDVATLYHRRVCGLQEGIVRVVLPGVMCRLLTERDADSLTPRTRHAMTLTVPEWSDPFVPIDVGDWVVRGVGRAVEDLAGVRRGRSGARARGGRGASGGRESASTGLYGAAASDGELCVSRTGRAGGVRGASPYPDASPAYDESTSIGYEDNGVRMWEVGEDTCLDGGGIGCVDPLVLVDNTDWISLLRLEHPELAQVVRVADRSDALWLKHRRIECR